MVDNETYNLLILNLKYSVEGFPNKDDTGLVAEREKIKKELEKVSIKYEEDRRSPGLKVKAESYKMSIKKLENEIRVYNRTIDIIDKLSTEVLLKFGNNYDNENKSKFILPTKVKELLEEIVSNVNKPSFTNKVNSRMREALEEYDDNREMGLSDEINNLRLLYESEVYAKEPSVRDRIGSNKLYDKDGNEIEGTVNSLLNRYLNKHVEKSKFEDIKEKEMDYSSILKETRLEDVYYYVKSHKLQDSKEANLFERKYKKILKLQKEYIKLERINKAVTLVNIELRDPTEVDSRYGRINFSKFLIELDKQNKKSSKKSKKIYEELKKYNIDKLVSQVVIYESTNKKVEPVIDDPDNNNNNNNGPVIEQNNNLEETKNKLIMLEEMLVQYNNYRNNRVETGIKKDDILSFEDYYHFKTQKNMDDEMREYVKKKGSK